MSYYRKQVTVAPTGSTTHIFENGTIYTNAIVELVNGADSTTIEVDYVSLRGVTALASSGNVITVADAVGVKLSDVPHQGLVFTPDGGGAANATVFVVAWSSIGRF